MAITDRFVSSSGVGTYAGSTSPAAPMSLATAAANAVAGDRINVKADGTYSQAATITPANSGTVTSPIWWRGYLNTPGDGDQGRVNGSGPLVTTNFPTIVFGSTFQWAGGLLNYHIYDSLTISASINAAAIDIGNGGTARRLNVSNTTSGGNANGIRATSGSGVITGCDVAVTGATAFAGVFLPGAGARLADCRINCTNNSAVVNSSGGPMALAGCLLFNSVNGIDITGTAAANGSGSSAFFCTFYSITGAAVRLPNNVNDNGIPLLYGCLLANCAYEYQNLFSATAVLPRQRVNCRSISIANADQGAGDWPAFGEIVADLGTGSSQDFINAAAGDFRLVGGSPAVGAGLPLNFDIGFSQRREAAAARAFGAV